MVSLNDIRNVDYATVFRWNVSFNFGGAGSTALDLLKPPLNLRCETAELPKKTNQVIEVNIRGHRSRHSGIVQATPTVTLTFIEDTANSISSFISAWRELHWAQNTGVSTTKQSGGTNNLAASMTLTRLNNQDVEIFSYKLFGVFIEDYEAGTLDGATSDFLKPTITFSYDDFTDGADTATPAVI